MLSLSIRQAIQKMVMTDKSIKLSADAQQKATKEKDEVSTKQRIHDEDAYNDARGRRQRVYLGERYSVIVDFLT